MHTHTTHTYIHTHNTHEYYIVKVGVHSLHNFLDNALPHTATLVHVHTT